MAESGIKKNHSKNNYFNFTVGHYVISQNALDIINPYSVII